MNCRCRESYICPTHRREKLYEQGSVVDNPIPELFSHSSPVVNKLIFSIIRNHRPYKHESGWAWCIQCNDANHGASESQPKWPCDAYALAQALVLEGELVK